MSYPDSKFKYKIPISNKCKFVECFVYKFDKFIINTGLYLSFKYEEMPFEFGEQYFEYWFCNYYIAMLPARIPNQFYSKQSQIQKIIIFTYVAKKTFLLLNFEI